MAVCLSKFLRFVSNIDEVETVICGQNGQELNIEFYNLACSCDRSLSAHFCWGDPVGFAIYDRVCPKCGKVFAFADYFATKDDSAKELGSVMHDFAPNIPDSYLKGIVHC